MDALFRYRSSSCAACPVTMATAARSPPFAFQLSPSCSAWPYNVSLVCLNDAFPGIGIILS